MSLTSCRKYLCSTYGPLSCLHFVWYVLAAYLKEVSHLPVLEECTSILIIKGRINQYYVTLCLHAWSIVWRTMIPMENSTVTSLTFLCHIRQKMTLDFWMPLYQFLCMHEFDSGVVHGYHVCMSFMPWIVGNKLTCRPQLKSLEWKILVEFQFKTSELWKKKILLHLCKLPKTGLHQELLTESDFFLE